MDKIHDIRFRFFVKGENISQIAVALQLDWKTVQKYVDMTNFNEPSPKPASEKRFCPKLDPYKLILSILLDTFFSNTLWFLGLLHYRLKIVVQCPFLLEKDNIFHLYNITFHSCS